MNTNKPTDLLFNFIAASKGKLRLVVWFDNQQFESDGYGWCAHIEHVSTELPYNDYQNGCHASANDAIEDLNQQLEDQIHEAGTNIVFDAMGKSLGI